MEGRFIILKKVATMIFTAASSYTVDHHPLHCHRCRKTLLGNLYSARSRMALVSRCTSVNDMLACFRLSSYLFAFLTFLLQIIWFSWVSPGPSFFQLFQYSDKRSFLSSTIFPKYVFPNAGLFLDRTQSITPLK